MIQIKGLTIKSRLEFAQAKGGERLMQRLREAPAPVGEIATAPMISLRNFPLATDDAVCRAIGQHLSRDNKIFAEMGIHSADTQRSFQKIILGVKTDPAAIIARFPRHFLLHLSGDIGEAHHEMVDASQGRVI